MSKIAALYHNEMIKLSRQIIVWVLLLLIVVSSVLGPLINLKMNRSYNTSNEFMIDGTSKADITKTYNAAYENLGNPNRFTEHSTIRINTKNEVVELFATYLNFGDDEEEIGLRCADYVKMSTSNALLIDYDFDRYPINETYLAQISYMYYMFSFRYLVNQNMVPFSERDSNWYEEYCNVNEQLEASRSALFNHDYQSLLKYEELAHSDTQISAKVAEIDAQGTMSPAEYNDLYEKLSQYYTYKEYLVLGVEDLNGSYVPLSSSRREDIQDSITILEYQLENHSYATIQNTEASSSVLFGIRIARFFLVILVIIISGSSISNEMATGSIKSLIIAPVKRWKIFTAKLLAIFTWVLAGGFLISLICTLTIGFKEGFSSLLPYFYVSGGSVKSIPYVLFAFLYFLVNNVSLIVYVLIAFAISCLSKNTGAACGLSTALVLSSSLSTLAIGLFGHKRWTDFLPSSNMDLTNKVFPHLPLSGLDGISESGLLSTPATITVSLRFSVIYLIIFVFVLLLIAYDGFVRRDIQ